MSDGKWRAGYRSIKQNRMLSVLESVQKQKYRILQLFKESLLDPSWCSAPASGKYINMAHKD